MRELNEYKKEIFVLSEKKIKRRRRNIIKITALCMPLCVCFVMFGLYFIPSIVSRDKFSPENNEMDLDGAINDNSFDDYVLYYVTADSPDGARVEISDKCRINKLYSLFGVSDGSSDMAGDKDTVPSDSSTETNEDKTDNYLFKITFEYINGKKTVYKVTEKSFINENGIEKSISEETFEEIKRILGTE